MPQRTVSIQLHGEANKAPVFIDCDVVKEDATDLTLFTGTTVVARYTRSLVYGWHYVDSEAKSGVVPSA